MSFLVVSRSTLAFAVNTHVAPQPVVWKDSLLSPVLDLLQARDLQVSGHLRLLTHVPRSPVISCRPDCCPGTEEAQEETRVPTLPVPRLQVLWRQTGCPGVTGETPQRWFHHQCHGKATNAVAWGERAPSPG